MAVNDPSVPQSPAPLTLQETTANAVVDQTNPQQQVAQQDADAVAAEKKAADAKTLAEHQSDQYFHNLWSGLPNYACPYCAHKSLGGPTAIDEHIYDYHPEKVGSFGNEGETS